MDTALVQLLAIMLQRIKGIPGMAQVLQGLWQVLMLLPQTALHSTLYRRLALHGPLTRCFLQGS
jgi:hypothetical protein